MKRHRRRKSRLWPIALVAAVLLLACVGAASFLLIDQTALKARLADAVLRATGRAVVFGGKLGIEPGAELVLAADDVALANAPGFSPPEMARVGHLEAHVAWRPLLDREVIIRELTVGGASILLETTATGTRNWRFDRADSGGPQAASEVVAGPARKPWAFAVREIRVRDSELRWRDGRDILIRVPAMRLGQTETGAPVTLEGDVTTGEISAHLSGEVTPQAVPASWPVRLVAENSTGRVSLAGSVAAPGGPPGYDFALEARVPALSALSGQAGITLPALRDLTLSARAVGAGTGRPEISGVVLHAGAADFETAGYGVWHLDHLDLAFPRLDAPLDLTLEGALGGTPLVVTATLGPGVLRPGAPGPFAIDVRAEAAGGRARASGMIARPPDLSGLDLALTADIPDLAALAPLAGKPLPGLKNLSLAARVASDAGAVAVRDIAIASPQGDLAGTASWRPAQPGLLTADIASRRLDLDALRAILAATPSPPQAAATPAAPAPMQVGRKVIPDTELPFAALNRMDGDVHWSIDELRLGGMTLAEFVAHAALHGGRLVLDPMGGQGASGRVDFFASVDAAASQVALLLRGNGLAVKPFLTASGVPDDVTAYADLAVDLRATGRTPRALAGSLDGHAALALADGEIDNSILAATLGNALRSARLPADFGQGKTAIRCLAVRLDATHGVVSATTLLLDTSRLLLQGSGDANLADETLALRLRPQLRVGAPGLTVPLRIGGSFAEPKAALDSGGMLGAFMAGDRRPSDTCAPALASARRP